jgi:hypothetical protein
MTPVAKITAERNGMLDKARAEQAAKDAALIDIVGPKAAAAVAETVQLLKKAKIKAHPHRRHQRQPCASQHRH